MNRRDFGRMMASALGTGALMPWRAWADAWKDRFDAALSRDPRLLAVRSASAETLATPQLELRGRIPAGLRGVLYRNGPARHDLAGARYTHWFDGDGMVQRYHLSAAGVSHTGRFVRTSKYAAETAAGKFLFPAFGTRFEGTGRGQTPDDFNAANTSVIPFAGELLALWEGGSAYQLDPETLATVGPKVWRRDLRGMPFSAHPRLEPDGTLWNFGAVNERGLVVYQISARGELLKADLIALDSVPMVHDFVVTERSLVFLLPPLVPNLQRVREGSSFLDSCRWDARAPMRVLVVDKADWSKQRRFELPNGFLFHLGNAWEDSAGVIRLDYVRWDDATELFGVFRDVMQGAQIIRYPGRLTFVTLDPASGRARQESRGEASEFPRVDPRVMGRRYSNLYALYSLPGGDRGRGANGIQRLEVESGRVDRYDYGAGFFPEEHIYVPDPAKSGEGSGWLLGTAIDLQRQVTVLSVFEASNLGAGPMAQASLPYALPAGFHGNFLAAPA